MYGKEYISLKKSKPKLCEWEGRVCNQDIFLIIFISFASDMSLEGILNDFNGKQRGVTASSSSH